MKKVIINKAIRLLSSLPRVLILILCIVVRYHYSYSYSQSYRYRYHKYMISIVWYLLLPLGIGNIQKGIGNPRKLFVGNYLSSSSSSLPSSMSLSLSSS